MRLCGLLGVSESDADSLICRQISIGSEIILRRGNVTARVGDTNHIEFALLDLLRPSLVSLDL